MRPSPSHRAEPPDGAAAPPAPPADPPDAAFTLTEMAASLVVAAMLVSGLAEITRQYARAFVDVRVELAATRSARIVQAELELIERADPDTLEVGTDRLAAALGGSELRIALRADRTAAWLERAVDDGDGGVGVPVRRDLPAAVYRFERAPDGAVRLWGRAGLPPLGVARPRREAPYDCRYDAVARRCR